MQTPSKRGQGRPVGCKTMNDREFQKYQRSLFLESRFFDNVSCND